MKRCRELLVLAGGFGTRLRSAIGDVPKPLAQVGDRPFLFYLIENWLGQGVTGLTFLLHHQAKNIEQFLHQLKAEGRLRDCDVRTVTEPSPMGTGGAVGHAVRHFGLRGSFLVANADTWLGAGPSELGEATAPAIAIMATQNTERYGSVKVEHGCVAAFQEKQGSVGPGWINAGLYHLPADLFVDRPAGAYSLERDIFPQLAAAGAMRAVPLDGEFIDIGVPADYLKFCEWIKQERKTSL